MLRSTGFRLVAVSLLLCTPACHASAEAQDAVVPVEPPAPAATQPTPPATLQPAASQPSVTGSIPFKPVAHVERRGTGPIAMVLIPGLVCDWTVFDSFMTRNAERYTMVAVTLPGFGGTEPPQMPPAGTFDAWLSNAEQAVWKVVQDEKLTQPVIVGHSLGGHLALRLGIAHACELRAVVSIDGFSGMPLGDPNIPMEARRAQAQKTVDSMRLFPPSEWPTVMGSMLSAMVTDPENAAKVAAMAAKTPQDVALRYIGDLFAADVTAQATAMDVRTLVIAAIPTRDVDPTTAQNMRQVWTPLLGTAPKITMTYFEDTRHFVQEDRPAELDAAIADFLAEREVKGVTAAPKP